MSDKKESVKALLARVRELDASATKGPWERSVGHVQETVMPEGDFPRRIANCYLTRGHAQTEWKNADFIAESRTLLPLLADRLQEAHRMLERAKYWAAGEDRIAVETFLAGKQNP